MRKLWFVEVWENFCKKVAMKGFGLIYLDICGDDIGRGPVDNVTGMRASAIGARLDRWWLESAENGVGRWPVSHSLVHVFFQQKKCCERGFLTGYFEIIRWSDWTDFWMDLVPKVCGTASKGQLLWVIGEGRKLVTK